MRLTLDDVYDLGAQFLLWEIAVAVAGAVLGIDPFDQPNVQESKDNTRRVLAELEERGEVPLPAGAGGAGRRLRPRRRRPRAGAARAGRRRSRRPTTSPCRPG